MTNDKTQMIRVEIIQRNISEEIKRSGLSHKEIAAKLYLHHSTIGKYARGDSFPALDNFAELCALLDISSDELLGLK